MASPQIEDGYTKIANELMDHLCHYRIPGEERQVLDCIFRKTYGWGKIEDAIALSQFVEMTGMKKPNIIGAIKSLLSKKIIIVIQKDNRSGHIYKINKDYETWQPLSKKITLSKRITSVIQKDNDVIQKDNETLSKEIPTKETIKHLPKETITKEKKKGFAFSLPDDVDPVIWDAFIEHRTKNQKKLTEYAKHLLVKKLEAIGQDKNAVLNQSIEKGWAGLFPLKAEGGFNGTGNYGRRGAGQFGAQAQGSGDKSEYPCDLEEVIGEY